MNKFQSLVNSSRQGSLLNADGLTVAITEDGACRITSDGRPFHLAKRHIKPLSRFLYNVLEPLIDEDEPRRSR